MCLLKMPDFWVWDAENGNSHVNADDGNMTFEAAWKIGDSQIVIGTHYFEEKSDFSDVWPGEAVTFDININAPYG